MKKIEILNKSYSQKAENIIQRYLRENQLREITKIVDIHLAEWLINEVRPKLISSSWRVYRNAIALLLEDDVAIARLKDTKPLNNRKNQSIFYKQTVRREKGLSTSDMQLIEDWLLTKSKSNYAQALLVWLYATIETGLRPHEWLTARIVQSKINPQGFAVVCTNAKSSKDIHGFMKTTNNAGNKTHQVERTIDISHLNGTNSLDYVFKQIELIANVQKGYRSSA